MSCRRSTLFAAVIPLALLLATASDSALAQSYAFFRVVGSGGQQSTAAVSKPGVSADGRVLVVNSASGGSLGGGAAGAQLVALDFIAGSLSIASTGPGGAASASATVADRPAASGSGRFVAFETSSSTWTGGVAGVHLVRVDRQTHAAQLINLNTSGSLPSGSLSRLGGISADGRFVVFTSNAANLVVGDAGTGSFAVFVRDLQLGLTERIDRAFGGGPGNGGSFSERPTISADGRWVAFTSTATNLVAVSPGGNSQRIWLHDRSSGLSRQGSVGPAGSDLSGAGSASISADGQWLAFTSTALSSNASRLWVRRVSEPSSVAVPVAAGGGACGSVRISSIGLLLAQCQQAQVGLPSQVYAWSTSSPQQPLSLLSGSDDANTVPGNGSSGAVLAISADGRALAFDSTATDLVNGDSNNASDVFVYLDTRVLDELFHDGFE